MQGVHMTGIYSVYAILLLISSSITLYLTYYSWNKRDNPDAFYFSLLMLAVSIWSLTVAFEMASTSIITKVFWSGISYLGIVFVGPLWILFTLSYTNYGKWLKMTFIGLLMVVPIVILILVLTNGWHGLIWSTITPSSSQTGSLIIYGHGLGFYVNVLYTYFLLFLGILLLIKCLIQSPKIYQKQVILILIAAVIPYLANIIYISQMSPVQGLDLTPFAFTITGILVALSIFKFGMLEIIPVAYFNLFDKMSSGAIVIDSLKKIVEINQAAENILNIDRKLIGINIEEKLEQLNDIYPIKEKTSEIKYEIKLVTPMNMWLDLQIIPLNKVNNQLLGWLITFRDINPRKEAEYSLKKSEKDYRDLVDNALLGIYKADQEGNIIFVNNSIVKMFGYDSKEEIENINITTLYKNLSDRENILKKLEENGKLVEYDVEMVKKSGEILNILASATLDGNTVSGMTMDVTEKRKAQNQIKRSLNEKEMLIKEIHHRVKNNLMVISSLLSLQSRYIKDEASKSIFKDSQNRARSMALIHELLYQSSDLKRINFGTYIRTLTNELFRIYVTDPNKIVLNMDIDDIMLDINTAIPLGLIVNELVSNSMKHAFPDNESGIINIKFMLDQGNYTMIVSDNGVGFPDGYDIKDSDSLGLKIVNSLTEQIEGKIKVEVSNGTKFTIEFKEETYK
jgi:PAS domain S-box-containing protein